MEEERETGRKRLGEGERGTRRGKGRRREERGAHHTHRVASATHTAARYDTRDSFSHRPVHHDIVTRSPNHMSARSRDDSEGGEARFTL
jgi:hypothetical protein